MGNIQVSTRALRKESTAAAEGQTGNLDRKCSMCGCRLNPALGDNTTLSRCRACAQRSHHVVSKRPKEPDPSVRAAAGRTEFGAADKALIRSVHGYMSPERLLEVLNARRLANEEAATPFTAAQLQEEIRTLVYAGQSGPGNWAGMRKALASARTSGLLDTITPQVIEDFAVVFSLSPVQAAKLIDIVRAETEEGEWE